MKTMNVMVDPQKKYILTTEGEQKMKVGEYILEVFAKKQNTR